MAQKLDEEAVSQALAGSSWRREGEAIVRDWEFSDFATAWAFACDVATAADRANHHPDILAHGWNKVRVTLSTHSAGGLTAEDFSLSQTIDEL